MKIKNLILSTAAAVTLGCTVFGGAAYASARAEGDVNRVEGKKFNLETSSTIKDYTDGQKQPKHMLDGDISTYWCSAWINETVAKCEEYVLFDFKEIVKIESLTLTARNDGMMFPGSFEFCWSTTNEVEIPVTDGKYTDYVNASDNVNAFTFSLPVIARYLKMNISARTPDASGIHLVCIAEADAVFTEATEEEKQAAEAADSATERPKVVNDPVLPFKVSASSYLEDGDNWLPEHLTDGLLATQWCSEWVAVTNEEDDITVSMTLEEEKKVSGVILSTQGVCFPRDFRFQYTFDGENYIDIPGAAYTDFETDGSQSYVFAFSSPQVATGIRLTVTKKTADPSGNYLVQLADVDVRGFAATAEEIETARKAFDVAIGNLPPDENRKPVPIPATPADFAGEGCGAVQYSGIALSVFVPAAAAKLLKKKENRYE